MIRLAPLTLALAVLAAGCGADRDEYAAEEMAADVGLSKAGAARPAVEAVPPPPPPAPGQVLADSAPPSMLIRTGHVTL